MNIKQQPIPKRLTARRHMRSIRAQEGWTFWSLAFVLGTIMFFVYVGMQLVPVYSVNENVKNAMRNSLDGLDLTRATRGQIIKRLRSQLYLDGNHKLLDYKKQLKISRSKTTFTIETNYEREIPMFFNLSLLAKFDNVVERSLSSGS